MFVNYSSGDRQSQPGAAFAFRAEERIEDAFLNFLRNALSSIGHLKDRSLGRFAMQFALALAGAQSHRPAPVHAFAGVFHKVKQHLLELLRVRKKLDFTVWLELQFNTFLRELRSHQIARFLQRRLRDHRLKLGFGRLGQFQEVL